MSINPFEGLPVYCGGKPVEEIFNCGSTLEDDKKGVTPEDSYMQIINETNENEFSEYCNSLEANGFVKEFSRENQSGIYCRLICGERVIYTYFLKNEKATRIIVEPKAIKLDDFAFSADSKLEDTALMQYGLYYSDMISGTTSDCGMMYVIRLRNNELIVVDGGEFEQSTEAATRDFLNRIHALTNTADDEKVVIAAWFCTHNHNDHMDFFSKLIAFHSDELELKRVMFNFPSERLISNNNNCTPRMKNRIKAAYPDAKFMRLHSGMNFSLGNASFDVLLTHEDVLPRQIKEDCYYDGINETSTVLKIEFDGQSIIFLGDTVDNVGDILLEHYNDMGLSCTYLQAAHHCINYVENIYTFVKAEKVLVPQCRYIAEKFHSPKYKIICDNYGAENVLFAGDCTRIFFANANGTRIEYYPVVCGSYDGSEY